MQVNSQYTQQNPNFCALQYKNLKSMPTGIMKKFNSAEFRKGFVALEKRQAENPAADIIISNKGIFVKSKSSLLEPERTFNVSNAYMHSSNNVVYIDIDDLNHISKPIRLGQNIKKKQVQAGSKALDKRLVFAEYVAQHFRKVHNALSGNK